MTTTLANQRISIARIVHVEAHEMDDRYIKVPEGFRVYLKSSNGDENYLSKDGRGFSGNVNSDLYAAHFETQEQAKEAARKAFGEDNNYRKMVWDESSENVMVIPTEKGDVELKGSQIKFDHSQLMKLVRRVAQLGEMHNHAALAEILEIGTIEK